MNAAPAPDDPRPPGTVLLQDFMQPLGISSYRVAKDLSLAPITVSQIIRGLRSISPAVACRLGTYFGVPPAYWLLVQASHEAHNAAKAGKANGTEICEALQLNSELQKDLRSKAMQTVFLGSNGNQSPIRSPKAIEPRKVRGQETEGGIAPKKTALTRSRLSFESHQSKREMRATKQAKKNNTAD